MDNQQGRFLGWLAGIIDGEGSITIMASIRKPSNNACLVCRVVITNTNLDLLNEVTRILNELGIKHWKFNKAMSYNGRKQCYEIYISKQEEVYNLLSVMKDYLVGKKGLADLVVRYIENRKNNLVKRLPLGKITRNGYTETDIQFYEKVKFLNGRKPSETLRQAPNFIGDDKGRTSVKADEVTGTLN